MAENVAYNMDCLEAVRKMKDNEFDLAVVDPPYGVNRFLNNQPTRLNKYGSMQTANDLKPTAQYFKELFRVSKNQIIWGYNHLSDLLPSTKEFIFWYKHQPVDTYSDGELAWTSFDKTAKCFDYPFFWRNGGRQRWAYSSNAKACCTIHMDLPKLRKTRLQNS